MIYKNLKQEFEYILWLRTRIQKITFGISRRVKTDSTTDFLLLTRKLKSYQEEFRFVTNELNSLLTNDSLLAKTDNIGQESGALPIRDAYCNWQEEELSLIHISEPTRRTPISYAVFCLKKKKK